MPKIKFKSSKDTREAISPLALQEVITARVKKADPSCELFSGVFIEHSNAKSGEGANWTIKGVKYGRADRNRASIALKTIVEEMQREFVLSDEGSKSAK